MCKRSEVPNYRGKYCYRWCSKYKFLGHRKTSKCKIMNVDVKDSVKDHDSFLDAGFRLSVPR